MVAPVVDRKPDPLPRRCATGAARRSCADMGQTLHSTSDLASLSVADAMHDGVLTCSPRSPLADVARLMVSNRVHCVVVADPSVAPALWGIVSDLDLVAAASVRELDGQLAGGSAGTPAVTVSRDASLQNAAQLMTEHLVAHLIVTDPLSERPVGVLSTFDVATALVAAADKVHDQVSIRPLSSA
jgi:CBS domain-containing protein